MSDQNQNEKDTSSTVDAVVIGAGFSGLYLAHKLQELGLNFRGFEAGPGVGGTWQWNRYPGARTDSLSKIYAYTFSKELTAEWTWTERYPSQAEVLAYLEHVADRFDLRQHFTFNTAVERADYDEESNEWLVQSANGEVTRSRFLLTAVGLLSAPNLPPFKGIEQFRGKWAHSARWPKEGIDLTGKKVAVVGTGSTGIQIIPAIADSVAELTVFQRTPNYVVPAQNRLLTTEEQEEPKKHFESLKRQVREHPFAMAFEAPGRNAIDVSEDERQKVFEEAWDKGGFHFLFESFDDLSVNRESNEYACDFIRSKIADVVEDSATAELLSPRGYPYGSKRPPAGTNYYETFNKPNVHIVDVSSDPIVEITPTGLRTTSESFDFDTIIFATGFDASTGSVTRIDIRGRSGESLAEKWKHGPLTNLGYSTAGFPNLLMATGPLSPFANIPTCSEETVDWIVDCIKYMQENGHATIESTPNAEAEWAEHVSDVAHQSLTAEGEKVNTWFAGANIEGKAHAINVYFGGANDYFARGRASADAGYKGFTLT